MRHLWILLLFLAGCIADQNNRQSNTAPQAGPTINLPTPKILSEADLLQDRAAIIDRTRQDILASSNQTQNQLSGLVNASVSKIAEQVKGVEANLHTNMTATAKLAEQLTTTFNTAAELKAELKMQVQASLDARLEIGKLQSQLGVQAGLMNRMETTTNDLRAGRDVNYVPKEMVEITAGRERTFTYIIGGILIVAVIAIGWIGRNARRREKLRSEEERRERQQAQELLLHVLSMLPEGKTEEVAQLRTRLTASL
jgi:hypothetical protein